MIRREENGQYLLIRQDDHAHLSRALAERIGNDRYGSVASSERGQSALLGIGLHDEGWPLHDDAPTLNGRGQPRDVFESKPELAIAVWAESARRAAAADPYAGLLVSLHVLALSAFALNEMMHQYSRQNLAYTRDRFDLNKFQHSQIELQQSLRTQLGLATDLPLHYGLSEPGANLQEDLLLYHFRTLQAMDRLSLALCCTRPPFDAIDLPASVGSKLTRVQLRRTSPFTLTADPWPFNQPSFTLPIEASLLASKPFASESEFHAAVAGAAGSTIEFRLASGNS